MQARNDQRPLNTTGFNIGQTLSSVGYSNPSHVPIQYTLQGQMYPQQSTTHLGPGLAPNVSMDDLTRSFGSTNLGSGIYTGPVKHWMTNAQGGPTGGPFCFQLPDGRVLVSEANSQAPHHQSSTTCNLAAAQYHHPEHILGAQYLSNPSHGQSWNQAQQLPRDVPDLAAPRRNSFSSNEENGPSTPFFGANGRTEFQPSVVVTDNSPQTWIGTPSPQAIAQGFYPEQLLKTPNGYIRADLDSLLQKDPAIPRPIPAIFSENGGRGTIQKAVENDKGTTNVYIRGLHPNTTDEMLHGYGERFGEIVSAKSMLDQQTGQCKGFGFIEYHNYDDGENCIRGFYHLGYEAKWARESHNAKLKTYGDPNNTNLYISGLPKDRDGENIKSIFSDYNVLSHKILRDNNGCSRGVGFARFDNPEICRQVIEKYTGQPVGTKGDTLQIRFADTLKQKAFKTITSQRRQFKTNEYNMYVYGPTSPYCPSPTTSTIPSSSHPTPNGLWMSQSPISPTFNIWPQAAPGIPIQPLSNVVPGTRTQVENVPFPRGRYSARIPIQSPSDVAVNKHKDVVKPATPTLPLTDSEESPCPGSPLSIKAEPS